MGMDVNNFRIYILFLMQLWNGVYMFIVWKNGGWDWEITLFLFFHGHFEFFWVQEFCKYLLYVGSVAYFTHFMDLSHHG
jgi:hypothetical protein